MPIIRRFTQLLSKSSDIRTRTQIVRYLITGFTAFGAEYGLYILLYRVWGWHYIAASTVVYAIMFWFVFIINRNWSFQSEGNIKKQVVQYGLLFLFNLTVANIVLMYLFIDILGISAYLSPILKMSCVVCWNFLIYKFIIYK